MKKIELSSVFIIGHDKIDREHAELFDMINNMNEAVFADNIKYCQNLWYVFIEKLEKLFAEQITIMKEFSFQRLVKHQIQSQNVLQKMHDVYQDSVKTNDWEKFTDEIPYNLISFILKNDLYFAEHLLEVGHSEKQPSLKARIA